MDQLGLGQTKMDIQNVVKEMLDKSGRDSVFKDNLPGKAWFSSSKRRNPGLILWRPRPFRKHETVTCITPFIIDEWFTDFLQYLEEIKARMILCEPGRLYRCEESSFQVGRKAGKRVFKGKTTTKMSQVNSSDDSRITVLATVSAEGSFPPPLIVLPSKNAKSPRTCKRGELKGAVYTQTQNGVMNPCTFLVFLTEIFQPFLIQKRVPSPVLLFVNEHSMYQSPEVTDFCTENGILLYQAPPHAPSAHWASDFSVAGCLNVEWNSAEKAYRENHPGCHITRTVFPSVFGEAWKRIVAKPSVGVDGFKAVGIYPFTKMYNLTKSMATI